MKSASQFEVLKVDFTFKLITRNHLLAQKVGQEKNEKTKSTLFYQFSKLVKVKKNILSLEGSEQKSQIHSLKSSLVSYSLSILFLTFRWVWDFWKWSQMISHGPNHGFRIQN